jgi:hypothetical protein
MSTSNLLGSAPQSVLSGAAVGQYRLVTVSAANTGIVTTAITDAPIGVSMTSAAAAGELVPLQTMGIAKIVASAAVAIGAQVMPTAAGAGKCATAAGATAKSIGIAMSAAGADGDVIEVLLALPAVNRPANS